MDYTYINKDSYLKKLELLSTRQIEKIQKYLKELLNSEEYRLGNPTDKEEKGEMLHLINNYLTKKYTEDI